MRSDLPSPGSGRDASFLAAAWVTWGEMSSWLHIAIIEAELSTLTVKSESNPGGQPDTRSIIEEHLKALKGGPLRFSLAGRTVAAPSHRKTLYRKLGVGKP